MSSLVWRLILADLSSANRDGCVGTLEFLLHRCISHILGSQNLHTTYLRYYSEYYVGGAALVATRKLRHENRYQVACPILQDAAVQEIVCTELDTCDQ